MLPCHNCYIYGTMRSEEVGRGKVLVGELTPQHFYQNYVPTSASFGVKRVL